MTKWIPLAFVSLLLYATIHAKSSTSDEVNQRETLRRVMIVGVCLDAYGRDDAHHQYPAPVHTEVKEHDLTSLNYWKNSSLAPHLVPDAWPIRNTDKLQWLKPILQPSYLDSIPLYDGWGNPLYCAVSLDRKHFTLISFGRNGKPDMSFRGYEWDADQYDTDIIYTENGFISAPKGVARG